MSVCTILLIYYIIRVCWVFFRGQKKFFFMSRDIFRGLKIFGLVNFGAILCHVRPIISFVFDWGCIGCNLNCPKRVRFFLPITWPLKNGFFGKFFFFWQKTIFLLFRELGSSRRSAYWIALDISFHMMGHMTTQRAPCYTKNCG